MIIWTSLPFLSYSKPLLLFSLISQTMSYSTLIQTNSPNNNEGEEDKDFCFWTSPYSESSRSKDILQGKNELMEMMQHIPESSFELSFQDMVVEQHQAPEAKPEPEQVESKVQQPQHKKMNEKKKIKKKENKSNSRHGKILRAESMESETFLLKMVFPTSLDWKKKTTKRQNDSKVEEKDKKWRIKSSSSNNSNDKSSFSFSQGCFPFFDHIKSKVKKDTLKLGGFKA
ncbi:uncharacterized protein LOC127079292 isoform X2 [Lathyrus oleraceus]|uniref:uncharacterized protein LOC127079292 isoform X2 n=1 Tax=Pisum sativum TaxID=3888 RepID=UPI0021CEB83C|nr:uncharacterized protein LOC127079292 isoform X2 [Pisum sativum]